MIVAIADTHATIWYLFGDSRLSSRAKNFIDEAARGGQQIGVSSITLAEIVYLQERGRIQPAALARIFDAFDRADSILAEVTFDRHTAQALTHVPRLEVPDLPDRIIAATALQLGVPLISRDQKIQLSRVETIW